MKGQTQQVFIYILAILIVGAVLLFGYRSINKIVSQSCDVDQATFRAQLRQDIEKNEGYGDFSRRAERAPCGFDQLCFINATANSAALDNYSLIKQEYKAGTGNNVFLVSRDRTIPLFGLDAVYVSGVPEKSGVLYINATGGTFYFTLEGIGKGKVSVAPDAG